MPVLAKHGVPRVARVSHVSLAACKLRSPVRCLALYFAPFKARSSVQSPTPLFVLPLDSEGGVLSAPVLVSIGHEVARIYECHADDCPGFPCRNRVEGRACEALQRMFHKVWPKEEIQKLKIVLAFEGGI